MFLFKKRNPHFRKWTFEACNYFSKSMFLDLSPKFWHGFIWQMHVKYLLVRVVAIRNISVKLYIPLQNIDVIEMGYLLVLGSRSEGNNSQNPRE